jgi:hypothetical protein
MSAQYVDMNILQPGLLGLKTFCYFYMYDLCLLNREAKLQCKWLVSVDDNCSIDVLIGVNQD